MYKYPLSLLRNFKQRKLESMQEKKRSQIGQLTTWVYPLSKSIFGGSGPLGEKHGKFQATLQTVENDAGCNDAVFVEKATMVEQEPFNHHLFFLFIFLSKTTSSKSKGKKKNHTSLFLFYPVPKDLTFFIFSFSFSHYWICVNRKYTGCLLFWEKIPK